MTQFFNFQNIDLMNIAILSADVLLERDVQFTPRDFTTAHE